MSLDLRTVDIALRRFDSRREAERGWADVGWQDRDYAKWTNKERRRFYGSSSGSGSVRRSSYSVGPGQGRLFGSRGRFLGRSTTRWAVALVVLVVGVLVLPHITIDGRHYHFWLIP